MPNYTVNLTIAAIEDVQGAMDYYNSCATGLGFRFTDEVNSSLQAIANMPKAYGYKYKNIRGKLLYKFPFLIFFIIDEINFTVKVLRIFHTSQKPFPFTKSA